MNEIFKFEYERACNTPTDINEHLPVLYDMASKVNHVTEFGVRDGQSTRAFLHSRSALRSYDLYLHPYVKGMFQAAQMAGKDVQYIQGNSLEVEIEPTNILFIDTDHHYNQLKAELEKHHTKVLDHIIFHDTQTYGCNPNEGNHGLLPAILEFITENKEWYVSYFTKKNNGLTIISKH